MRQSWQGSSPPPVWGRRMGALLGACAIIGAAACSDVPTGVEPAWPVGATEANVQREIGVVEVVCTTSRATPGGQHAYEYGLLTVLLPANTRAADGRLRPYRYRGYAQGKRVVLAADCAIPNTEAAYKQMNLHFGVKPEHAGRGWKESGAGLMSTDYLLDGLEVNACRYGGEWPDCEAAPPPPPPDNNTQPCWGGDNCGGGGTYTPTGRGDDPDPQSDPCKTGDPIPDSREMAPGMDGLWDGSNPDAARVQDRKELGGWIVKTGTGFKVVPWTNIATNFCGGGGTEPWPPEGPSAVVGFIHTHPYAFGERVPTCEGAETMYLGIPSADADMATSMILGAKLGYSGGLPGYILDKSGISRFDGTSFSSATDRFARCAY